MKTKAEVVDPDAVELRIALTQTRREWKDFMAELKEYKPEGKMLQLQIVVQAAVTGGLNNVLEDH